MSGASILQGMPGAGERILLTLWVGGLWAIGYVAAPVLFKMLPDRQLAGLVAGQYFTAIHLIGLLCGGMLLVTAVYRLGRPVWREWTVWLLTAMLVMDAAFLFGMQPMMQELKALGLDEPGVAERFRTLHGVSSGLYLLESLMGLALVVFGLALRPRTS